MSSLIGQRLVQVATRSVPRMMAARSLPVIGFRTRRGMATEPVPEEDYYDGHLMADHLEYIDDMIEKTVQIESFMTELKDTYAQKRKAVVLDDSSTLSKEELDALFAKAAIQKEQISSQLESMKGILLAQKSKAGAYAVDAPDGTSDGQFLDGIEEANEIIDYAAKHEDTAKIRKQHEWEDAVQKERARDPEHDW